MIRPGSALTKQKQKKAAVAKAALGKKADASKPELQSFLDALDYVGAITLLEFERKAQEERAHLHLWLGFCYFHNGDYQKALDIYNELLQKQKDCDSMVHAYKACCLYALCQYQEAED